MVKSNPSQRWCVMICASVLQVVLLASAESQTAPAAGNSVPQSNADEFLIGSDDVLKIFILDVPELSGEYRVSNVGTVQLPVLKTPVKAAGLTLSQFSETLSAELKSTGVVSDPHVTTTVDASRLHSVAITGAVKKPQVYLLFSQTTLLDMLSLAEGLAEDASGIAVVTRGPVGTKATTANADAPDSNADATHSVTIDVKRLLDTGDPKLNVNVYPGDRITVPHAGIVYVVGAVNKPGGFTMKPSAKGLTVLQALALAENPTDTAKRNQTVIFRNDAQAPDGRRQVPVEIKKIIAGQRPDIVLEAEDILFVPDSAGKRALHRGVGAAVAVTTGIAIYRGKN